MSASAEHTLAELRRALDATTYLVLTTRHPTYGIECTMDRGEAYVSRVNQPDPITAILTCARALDAGENDDLAPSSLDGQADGTRAE